MANFINHERANDFLKEIEDPYVRKVVEYSYFKLWLSNAVPESDFDLLFYFRVLTELLRDREEIAKTLMGDIQDGHSLMTATTPMQDT